MQRFSCSRYLWYSRLQECSIRSSHFRLFQLVKSDKFINSPYNSLQDLFAKNVVRGEITTADYEVLASEENCTDLWTAAQLPAAKFATADEAVAAGYNTLWTLPDYLGMPACDLINSGNVVVSLPLAYNYMSVGSGKYSGSNYTFKLIMGMNNSTRDGIDPDMFLEGLENNDYVRKAGDSDQGNPIYDAIIKVNVKSANYGSITLRYNRGGNNSAMYVVDSTKLKRVLWSVTRCPDDNIQTHVARFGVEPGHTYYIMASEKSSVELYGIEYDECTDADYEVLASEENCTDLWTAAQLPAAKFANSDCIEKLLMELRIYALDYTRICRTKFLVEILGRELHNLRLILIVLQFDI